MKKGYEVFLSSLEERWADVERGAELILEVRDLCRLERKVVLARVDTKKQDALEGQELWIRGMDGFRWEEPLKMTVVRVLSENETPLPRDDATRDEIARQVREKLSIYSGLTKHHSDGLMPGYFMGQVVPPVRRREGTP